MAGIKPFRALRYNPQCVPDLSAAIAPPYDVITPQEQDRLYQASPHNIVRLMLGKESPEDTPQNNRYTRAARDFSDWKTRGVLEQDAQPALYLIEHTFQDQGAARTRLGFLGLLGLDGAMERIAYRHEATLAAPKVDRTKLLEAVPANLEPIFCVYPDEGGNVQAILRQIQRAPPAARASFGPDSVRLWAITDTRTIDQIAQQLAPVTMLIADGHHRFEVAWAHRAKYGAMMAYFASMADPALAVRPIYRVISGGKTDLAALRQLSSVEPTADASALLEWLKGHTREGCFGLYDGRTSYRVQLTPESLARWLIAPPVPMPIAALDVSILHGLLLPNLGLNGAAVHYTGELSHALRMAEEGQGAATTWLLRPISLTQVYALASQGLVLPPKSTYFYPKVPSGLAIHLLS